jgi:hypothetical protein
MKLLLILAFVIGGIGLCVLSLSAYFALAYYLPATSRVSTPSFKLDEKLDSDGDGLTDKLEVEQYHTDPHRSDTDGDGYSDKQEIDAGYNPLIPAGK